MLMGLEKKRKEEEEELESTYFLGSELSEIHDNGDSSSEVCKDVDVVSVVPESSTSAVADSLVEPLNEYSSVNSRIKYQDNHRSLDYDVGLDGLSVVSSSIFEFQKSERASQRVPLPPFSKPAPSKWDDAQKWIASPNLNRPKVGQSQMHIGQAVGTKKPSTLGYGSRQPNTKVLVEVPDQRLVAYEELDTKRIDVGQAKKDYGGQKFVSWETDPYLDADTDGKPVLMIENSLGEAAISLSQHDSSISVQSATTFVPPPSTARSVSMRDMGTEMTPIASQEPSRTGTPVSATTPIRSPRSSRPSSPGRPSPMLSLVDQNIDILDLNGKDLSEKEMQKKTRSEIMALGKQLGKANITAWASKEVDTDASTSQKNLATEQPEKSVIEARAAAWEEAEKAKYMARFKRDEIKIEAWENHQKAMTEAEMRKTEVKVERIRGQAHDRLMNKLAALRHKAEERRAAAEAKRSRQAAKTDQQADYIRHTGRIPPSMRCCCF